MSGCYHLELFEIIEIIAHCAGREWWSFEENDDWRQIWFSSKLFFTANKASIFSLDFKLHKTLC